MCSCFQMHRGIVSRSFSLTEQGYGSARSELKRARTLACCRSRAAQGGVEPRGIDDASGWYRSCPDTRAQVVSQAPRGGIIAVTKDRMNTVQIACLPTGLSAL